MKVLVFGATGMVGQGVLRECLLAADVELAVTIGRTRSGVPNPKLRETVHTDLENYSAIESGLRSFDTCFFCLVSSCINKRMVYSAMHEGQQPCAYA
jgi:uncharacterized protein YbjT (DUF2867 family)